MEGSVVMAVGRAGPSGEGGRHPGSEACLITGMRLCSALCGIKQTGSARIHAAVH